MSWIKQHVDSVAVISAVAIAVYWMTNQIHDLEKRMDVRLAALEKDMTIIKTVLIMKGTIPKELAAVEEGNR